MARHDLQPAMADFSRAITLAPGDPQYYLLRAAALRQSQQLKPAEADLDQALTLSPGDLKALTARAELRIATGNPAGAGSDLDTASRLAPKPSDLRLDLANLYSEIDRRDAAIGEYDLWLSFHPDDAHMATALNGRCWARALNGRDLDKALADCNRAVRMATKSASLLDSRGLVYLRLGQYDRAIADYDAALALQPQLAWSLYGRGLAKQRLGKRAEGEADVAKAVGLRPALPDEAKRYGIVPAAEALTAAR
jgi:tetratricopeptide (TPR) repeat protein